MIKRARAFLKITLDDQKLLVAIRRSLEASSISRTSLKTILSERIFSSLSGQNNQQNKADRDSSNLVLNIYPNSITNFLLLFFVFLGVSCNCFATKQITEVSYFASLRASETNIRSGPGANYPIKFSFHLKGVPVRVVSEYDNWNEIEDYEGQKGWVNQSLISKKRNLMIQTKQKVISLFSKNDEKSRILLYLENFVIGDYLGCVEDWCNIKVENKKGWVKRSEVFGSDTPNEEEPNEEAEDQ